MTYMSLTWEDPESPAVGYLVIDRLIDGAASGGLRMRAGCTLAEVGDLARAMTLKEAVVYDPADSYRPFGGAKGGIDCDPYDPAAADILRRYADAMAPLLRTRWATGEDFGLQQEEIDSAFAAVGLQSSIEPALARLEDPASGLERLRAGFAVTVDGISLAELVGGYGVAATALSALRRGDGATAVVQGFGSMGGATARYLAQAGVRVVGIADRDGLIANPAGLDVERLLTARDRHGAIDRAALRPDDEQRPGEEWLALDVDLLVPAAISYAIDAAGAQRIRARVIAEAANVATSEEAQIALDARGVRVIPDFVSNVATNAWWYWTLYGDIEPDRASAFAKIDATLPALTEQLLARADSERILPRAAATAIADEKIAALQAGGVSLD